MAKFFTLAVDTAVALALAVALSTVYIWDRGSTVPVEEPPAGSDLPPELREEVNRASDRGLGFLKQAPRSGHWGMHPLVGLTLLECGVRADDEVVRDIAARVRQEGPQQTQTYNLALAILFLDKLRGPEDEGLIRHMAARLIAGQNDGGGWTYTCPALGTDDEERLFALLGDGQPSRPGAQGPARGPGKNQQGSAGQGADVKGKAGRRIPGREGLVDSLAVVRHQPGDNARFLGGGGDNSNTQFAILGVWAAGRHGVPVGRSLALINDRFRHSQSDNGSWGYNGRGTNWPDSMTCAGLLGLAVGRVNLGDDKEGAAATDRAMARGLEYLGERIRVLPDPGGPGGGKMVRPRGKRGGDRFVGANAHGDLYFLWSVERVGMLYNLKAIHGQEWYAWGVPLILDAQHDDGSWSAGHGPVADTCFALLFLKRVNVAKDLTKQLDNLIRSGKSP